MSLQPAARRRSCRAMPTRRVAILVFDGVQSLDVTGPLEVFAIAQAIARRAAGARRLPRRADRAARPGVVHERLGAAAGRRSRPIAQRAGGIDTLVVAGGDVRGGRRAIDALLRWLGATGRRVRRLASVCTGSFLLAEAGLLRRPARHHALGRRPSSWRGAIRDMRVEPDAIFVRDGNVYTSAGVTAGIDLALALVEEDLGHAVALDVARRLVVFLKRPGGQSQFSSHLAAQAVAPGPLRDLPQWIVANLDADLSVEQPGGARRHEPAQLRARVPARDRRHAGQVRRACAARRGAALASRTPALGLDEVASRCGFGSAEQHAPHLPPPPARRADRLPQTLSGQPAPPPLRWRAADSRRFA